MGYLVRAQNALRQRLEGALGVAINLRLVEPRSLGEAPEEAQRIVDRRRTKGGEGEPSAGKQHIETVHSEEEFESMKTLGLVLCLIVMGAVARVAQRGQRLAPPPPVEVHGYMQFRYYVDTAIDDTRDKVTGKISNEVKQSHLEFERISLSGLARLPEGNTAYAEVYIHPWLPNTDPSFLYLESLFVDFPQAPDAKVRVGKGRDDCFGLVPAYGNRKFSNYSPVEEAFTQDRVLGFQMMTTPENGKDNFNFGILNSERPGVRYIGMAADEQLDVGGTPGGSLPRTTVAHLADRDAPGSRSNEIQFDARYVHTIGPVNVGLSGRIGQAG